jgi:hypothetical protein
MKVLVYCLFLDAEKKPPLLRGVNGRPVHVVCARGLCAALSAVGGTDLSPTLERIQAYEAVVEAIFADRAVVPMRYGSTLPSRDEVLDFLRDEGEHYTSRLRALTGCVEMGLRLVSPIETAKGRAQVRRSRRLVRPASTPGRAYLQSREQRYEVESNPHAELAAVIERYRRTFEDLSVEFKAEPAMPMKLVLGISGGRLQVTEQQREGNRSLALYFLVPRDAVPAFRERARHLDEKRVRRLVSGPWPPYNFVGAPAARSTSEVREARE